MMHKGKIRSRIDVILVGTGMAIAFWLILIRLFGLIESTDPSSSEIVTSYFQRLSEIVTSYFQRLCVTMPFDLTTLCR
ncbi:MAG TPA: hypothetical protein VF172_06065 [Nitrososphaera sp.]|jgi:hypothetical protein